MTSKTIEKQGTRDRALAAAEKLFVQLGYDGTSFRAISKLSDVKLGSLVYFFKTKEELFSTLCQERLGAVINTQTQALENYLNNSDNHPNINLCDALRIVSLPVIENCNAMNTSGLYRCLFTDPSPTVISCRLNIYEKNNLLMYKIFRLLTPHLSDKEFHWRYIASAGTFMAFVIFNEEMTMMRPDEGRKNKYELEMDKAVEIIANCFGINSKNESVIFNTPVSPGDEVSELI